MAKKREKDTRKPFTLPLGAQILGVIVEVLNLKVISKDEVLGLRTATDYFRGDRGVKESSQAEVHRAVVRACAEALLIPKVGSGVDEAIYEMIATAVGRWLAYWDATMADIRHRPVSPEHGRVLIGIVLRLVVIDLSIRIGTGCVATGDKRPDPQVPTWGRRDGRSQLLRSFLSRCDSPASRDALAEALKVHVNSVDAWLHKEKPITPSDENLQDFAAYIASRAPVFTRDRLLSELRRGYAMCDLAARLAGALGGWDPVTELSEHLMRYATHVFDELLRAGPPPEVLQGLGIAGTRHPAAVPICEALWHVEPRRDWQTDLRSAPNPWTLRLQHVVADLRAAENPEMVEAAVREIERRRGPLSEEERRFTREFLPKIAATTAQVDMSMPMRPADAEKFRYTAAFTPPPEGIAELRLSQLQECLQRGDFAGAIAHGRRAVEVQPVDANCHCLLASALNRAGHFDEAERECWLAYQLRPGWEEPIREIGIILTSRGDTAEREWRQRTGSRGCPDAPAFYRAACEHFDQKVLTLPVVSPLSHFYAGAARMKAEDYAGAAEEFERVIAVEPQNAMALDYAAHCCFLTGNHKRGRELAKEAHRRGATYSLERWKAGGYNSSTG